MRKITAMALLCAILLSGCTKPQLETAVMPSPAEALPQGNPEAVEGIIVEQGGAFTSQMDGLWNDDGWLSAYRPFPAEYGAEELRKALDALPLIHIETPRTGKVKIYLRDDPLRAGYLTSGEITKEGLGALLKDLNSAKKRQQLNEILAEHKLSFQSMNPYSNGSFALYDEIEEVPCHATLRELEEGVVLITIAPENAYRTTICHLVFREANGAYRFAAMSLPLVDYSSNDDMVIAKGDSLYFECHCSGMWGTGTYTRDAMLFSLEEGAHEHLYYQMEGFSSPWDIAENLAISISKVERSSNGGVHFVLQGTFDYENLSGPPYEDFSKVFRGTATFHVYDDQNGKGFYTYADDMKTEFSLRNSEQLKEAMRARFALLLRAEDEAVCLLAENFLCEWDISVEGYPYKMPKETYGPLEELWERVYAPGDGNGQKYYIGNAAPMPAANGSLTEEALEALFRSLSDPQTDADEAIETAGLQLPYGVVIPREPEVPEALYMPPQATACGVFRHEEGDALVLELRIPEKDDGYSFQSFNLLFLRDGANYALITALTRKGDVYEEIGKSVPYIVEANGLSYLHYSAWTPEEGGQFREEAWVPFEKGGVTSRLRMSGGCMLGDLPGRPLSYWLDFPPEKQNGKNAQTLDATIYYREYASVISFTIPLRLYNDGDGKGFYSLDGNTPHFFTDILSVPYAKDQVKEQLAIRAEGARRSYRAAAIELTKAIFGG